MRIPPYHRQPGWQRFFAGMMAGAAAAWCVFLFTYGVLQEKQVKIIQEQKSAVLELTRKNSIYQEDSRELNEEVNKKLVVQELNVKLTNGERFKLSPLTIHKIEIEAKKDLSDLLERDLESIFESRKIIKKAIENKVYRIDDKDYRLLVKEMTIYTTLYLEVEVSFVD
ncbi:MULTISPECIES: sporulation membrane protein YtrI [Bacillaceae]|uniref:Sporulation membrane protein YtrI n=1 Tax=Metabacillus sediminis TaxID=3117746 RepID=A0ABZ2NDS0_9BACI|nr:sporulation membrane protein YtrI [Bacillus sp. SJS]KZZ85869.1 sporulation protein [Bacillus sp. SJS]